MSDRRKINNDRRKNHALRNSIEIIKKNLNTTQYEACIALNNLIGRIRFDAVYVRNRAGSVGPRRISSSDESSYDEYYMTPKNDS